MNSFISTIPAASPLKALRGVFPFCLFGLCAVAHAADVEWLSVSERADNLFNTGANWDTGTVPGSADDVYFNLSNEAYTVDFTGVSQPLINDRLFITGGSAIFNLPTGVTYQLAYADGEDLNDSYAIELNLEGSSLGEVVSLNLVGGGTLRSLEASYVGSTGETKALGTASVTIDGSTWRTGRRMRFGWNADANLTIINGGRMINDNNLIMLGLGGDVNALVSGTGSEINADGALLLGTGAEGVSRLRVEDGGALVAGSNVGVSNAIMTVTGSGSSLTGSGDLRIGDSNNSAGSVYATDSATLTFAGPARDILIGNGNNSVGRLSIANGASVLAGRTVDVGGGGTNSSGELTLIVSNNTMLTATNFNNRSGKGTVNLYADPRLAAGDYTPIAVSGTWTNEGALKTIGGLWDEGSREFSVGAAHQAMAGQSVELDLGNWQRLDFDGGPGSLRIGFDPTAIAGDADPLAFAADVNSVGTIDDKSVVAAWDFTTNIASGFLTMVSFDVGAGANLDLLELWYSPDGLSWELAELDLTLHGEWATFLASDFSSYAVTQIPEPSYALLALLVGLVAARRLQRRISKDKTVGC